MGSLIRAFNWAASPVGDPAEWPQALRTIVRLILSTNHPMFIFWGDDHICFYNDAYRASIGSEKHPAMLGAKGQEMWPEIWPIIGPQIDQVMSGGDAIWHEDQLVPILRHGSIDEVYWTYGYSPIDHEGTIGGVLVVCTETTQKVLSERSQTEGLERLRELVQQSPGFIAVLSGPDHRFELVNDAYQELFLGNTHAIGRSVADVFPEVAEQGFTALLDEVFTTGRSHFGRDMRLGILATEGRESRELFLDFIYKAIRNPAGEIVGVFVDGYDVTERSRSANALADSERRYRDLVQNQTEMICRFRPDGEILFSNNAYARAVGVDPDKMTKANVWDFINAADRPAVEASLARLSPDMRQVRIENQIQTPDGARWTLWTNSAIRFGANGELQEAQSTGIDITERKRVEEALRESEARFRHLSDHAPVMIWVSEADGQCVYRGRSWYELTGQSVQEGLRAGWLDAVHPEDREAVASGYRTAVEEQTSFRIEYRVRAAEDEYRWTMDSAVPRFDEARQYLGHVGSITDIDARRRQEDLKSLLLDELNHRVKNTLAVVQGIAQQTFRPDGDVRSMRASFNARLHALAVVHNALTRAEWGKTSLREIAEETLALTRQSQNRVEISGEPAELGAGAALAIAMAFHELGTNALKYGALSSATGRVSLTWKLEPQDPSILHIIWRESGGPPVVAPTAYGFGFTMIKRALEFNVGANVEMNFDPEGFQCTIKLPLGGV
jgi:PAS domain S-box-containing protein